MSVKASSKMLSAVAACTTIAALALTGGTATAQPHAPAPLASCAATVTVAETRIAPGFVGQEVKRITEFGPNALPGVVRPLATNHLGAPEACAALIGE